MRSSVVAFSLLMLFFIGAVPLPVSGVAQTAPLHLPVRANQPVAKLPGTFSFVSSFESGALEGWGDIRGQAPTIANSTFFGEPSLLSTSSGGPQVDFASKGFVRGSSAVSFQVAMSAGEGSGFFGLEGPDGPVAVVGVSNGGVYAGPNPQSSKLIEEVPSHADYPSGWVYLTALIQAPTSSGSGPSQKWVMELFVDRTDAVAANVTVPAAWSYDGAVIITAVGAVQYTNIVVSSYDIPIFIPGYNPMEGYGQGSGLLVSLLPAFYNLTAQMYLRSWSTPEAGILSFQTNAMNYTGTTQNSCVGFFQLGADLDPGGTIAPWWVRGNNCVAHYFTTSPVPTPFGSRLVITILYLPGDQRIVFIIKDLTTGENFIHSMPYQGGPFFGTYTQLEFQPSAKFPIQDYKVQGALYDNAIITMGGKTRLLGGDYMLPFTLDAPPSWDFTFYSNSFAGYGQIVR